MCFKFLINLQLRFYQLFYCKNFPENDFAEGPEVLSSNACNKLLEDFLQTRFPNLFDQDSNVCDEEGCPQEKLLRYWLSLPNEDGRGAVARNSFSKLRAYAVLVQN